MLTKHLVNLVCEY